MSARAPAPGLRLILGSASPRRRDLLAQIGIVPDAVRPPEIDEAPLPGELPEPYVARMAEEKAAAVPMGPDELVLSADTTVFTGRRIFGKPADRAEADTILRHLSGRRHKVATAVAVRRGDDLWCKTVTTVVRMKPLSDAELTAYLDSDDWRGKAGAYAIQGPAARLIPWISGSYSAVVGLPLAETAQLLDAAGYRAGPAQD